MANPISTRGGSRSQLAREHVEFELKAAGLFEDAATLRRNQEIEAARAQVQQAADAAREIDHTLAEIAANGCPLEKAERAAAILTAELNLVANPILGERQGLTKILIAEGTHEPSGSTVVFDEAATATPHRRKGKGAADGPEHGKSRKTYDDRRAILERSQLVAKTFGMDG